MPWLPSAPTRSSRWSAIGYRIPGRHEPASRRRATSAASPVVLEPFDDGGHVLLEAARDEEIQEPDPLVGAVLEVVRDAGRDPDERALAGFDPPIADQDARRAFEDVEHLIVVLMMVGAGAGVLRLHPPLRHRIALLRLLAVGFEHGAHEAHVVGSPLLRRANEDASGKAEIVRHVISALALLGLRARPSSATFKAAS